MGSQMTFDSQDQLNPETPVVSSSQDSEILPQDMNNHIKTVKSADHFSNLLELAAGNDIEGFTQSIQIDSAVDDIGLWYARMGVSRQMVLKRSTALMVAAAYGSVDVVKLILSLSEADVNRTCSSDKTTALHCAASGGSSNAVDVVNLLLLAGADPNSIDDSGSRPFDVIVAPPRRSDIKVALKELLKGNDFECELKMEDPVCLKSSSPPLSLPESDSLSTALHSTSNPLEPSDELVSSTPGKKEYPIDPTLDIKNGIYSSDEFRMFSFKVWPCSRAYSHDWTECPFVHPSENARRRDPRKYHYSCVPCPDFRKGTCMRGDMCEYAHGVFECWLHPAQYKTRLCKDGTYCNRRVCFFAHLTEELRPLYLSTGSGVPSPRSSNSMATPMDMAMALNLFPGSPSAASVMPSAFSSPMSPSGNGLSHPTMPWPQQNIPALHLPLSNLQASRLRLSLNARDLEARQQQLLNDLSGISPQQFDPSPTNLSIRSNSLTPSNLDQRFCAEHSPRYTDQVFSPPHRSLLNQLQQQSMFSPVNTNGYSPKNVAHPLMQQGSFGVSSPGMMSPRNIEPVSPLSARLAAFAHHEKQQQQQQQQQQFRSLSSRDFGSNLPKELMHNSAGIVGSPVNSWPKWEPSNGKVVDWSVQGEELSRFPKSSSIGLNSNDTKLTPNAEDLNTNSPPETIDHAVLGEWLEQMHLDQMVAS